MRNFVMDLSCLIATKFQHISHFSTNVDRQGEGGTLKVNEKDFRALILFCQGLLHAPIVFEDIVEVRDWIAQR